MAYYQYLVLTVINSRKHIINIYMNIIDIYCLTNIDNLRCRYGQLSISVATHYRYFTCKVSIMGLLLSILYFGNIRRKGASTIIDTRNEYRSLYISITRRNLDFTNSSSIDIVYHSIDIINSCITSINNSPLSIFGVT